MSVRAYTISLKLKPDELQTRVRLAALVRTQSEVQARLTAIQTLQMLEVGPTVEPTIELLEEKIRLQKMAQHKDLKATCDALLKLAPDNALAKETLAGLGQ